MPKKQDWSALERRVKAGDVLAFYSTNKWKQKRRQILARDHNNCQRCLGKFDSQGTVKLRRARTVHHIVPLKENFSLALVDSNLVSLCFNCHEEIEGRAEWKTQFAKPKERLTEEKW